MNPDTLEHLKVLQTIIDRMNRCSFECKKWSIGLVAGLLVAAAGTKPWVGWYSVVPILVFWWLDAYYLRTERAFRRIFDAARDGYVFVKKQKVAFVVNPFEMPLPTGLQYVDSFVATLFAPTIWPIHFSILVGTLVATNAGK